LKPRIPAKVQGKFIEEWLTEVEAGIAKLEEELKVKIADLERADVTEIEAIRLLEEKIAILEEKLSLLEEIKEHYEAKEAKFIE